MSLLESVKKAAERLTGLRRPSAERLRELVDPVEPTGVRLTDDGKIPNHPFWPLLVYRHAVKLPSSLDPAAIFEELFESNGWGESWRNGIYDYAHFHSRTHEVLGIARGSVKVRFGGRKGRTLTLKAGDVAILPAGTGHQSLSASTTLLVVGAYPASGRYDECKPTTEDHARALKSVVKVPRPRKDPVFGKGGPLLKHWPSRRNAR